VSRHSGVSMGALVSAGESDPVIAITPGEPAGIGPDLCVLLAQRTHACRLVVIADRELLAMRAQTLGCRLEVCEFGATAAPPGALQVLHQPLAVPARAGQLDPANAAYVAETLRMAATGCLSGRFDAMVTGPVHKTVLNEAGIAFTGHTEFLAELTGAPNVVMMLVGGGLRVALATTHLPLRAVPDAITRQTLTSTLRTVRADLMRRFGILCPRVLVAGLNPHAGEGGYLGREEIDVIIPVLERLRAEGFLLEGPLPADTLFSQGIIERGDCVLAMYHDQGLPVLKRESFGGGVNVTLGLPIIRTSVDHGTALDRAGTGDVEVGSLAMAISLASRLVRTERGATIAAATADRG